MKIVTAASDNHLISLQNFIKSFITFYKNDPLNTLVVYSMGIESSKWAKLQSTYCYYNIKYCVFYYSPYPDYVDIKINVGEYAWKPIIVYLTCIASKDNIVVWMDAGNLIERKLDQLFNSLQVDCVHSSTSGGIITDWVYYRTINYMKCNNKFINYSNRSGACIGFNYAIDWVKDIVKEWYNLALIKECIAPPG